MPGINGLTNRLPSRKVKYILFFSILFLIAAMVTVFIRHRFDRGITPRISPPDTAGAVLSIQGFRHTASQDGKKQWTLEADSAHLHVDPSEARLINILALFFPENGKIIRLTAEQGLLQLDTKNMSASGNILIQTPEYNIKTENLHYDHQLHIIKSVSAVNVIGPSFRLNAGKMTYNIRTGEITCTDHVEGFFSDIAESTPD